jgi:sulfopyruvate decarboxylase subunit alpha
MPAGSAHVLGQLVRTAQHRRRDRAVRPPLETRPVPDLGPGWRGARTAQGMRPPPPKGEGEGGQHPVPVSLESSRRVYEALKACDVRLISALPETWLVHIIRMAEEDPAMTLVRLAREEEGVGISAGAHLAGVNSAMLMQNHGLLAAVNPIVSLALLYKIPLLMLISYRGHMGERDPWQTQGGLVTEPLLQALNIPTWTLRADDDVTRRIRDAQTLAHAALHPVAVLLTRELMWEEA